MTSLKKTIADYTAAIVANPQDADAYHRRGVLYHKAGNLRAAIADFTEALRLRPDFGGTRENLQVTINQLQSGSRENVPVSVGESLRRRQAQRSAEPSGVAFLILWAAGVAALVAAVFFALKLGGDGSQETRFVWLIGQLVKFALAFGLLMYAAGLNVLGAVLANSALRKNTACPNRTCLLGLWLNVAMIPLEILGIISLVLGLLAS